MKCIIHSLQPSETVFKCPSMLWYVLAQYLCPLLKSKSVLTMGNWLCDTDKCLKPDSNCQVHFILTLGLNHMPMLFLKMLDFPTQRNLLIMDITLGQGLCRMYSRIEIGLWIGMGFESHFISRLIATVAKSEGHCLFFICSTYYRDMLNWQPWDRMKFLVRIVQRLEKSGR